MASRCPGVLASVGVAILLAGCAQSTASSGSTTVTSGGAGGPVAVATSTNVWADVAAAVGGDAVAVTAIIADSAGDPHSYQATGKDAVVLRDAALVVSNGGGYDPFVDQILGSDGPRRVVAIDEYPDDAAGGTANEHVWYDLPTVSRVADKIASELGLIRPAAKPMFAANAEQFRGRLTGLQHQVAQIAGAHAGTPIAATESVAHYLLEAAKLSDQTPPQFVEAIEAETDPPAGTLASMQRLITDKKIAVLVHNPQTDTRLVTDLVQRTEQAGIPVANMTETLPSGLDYVRWMGNQINALSAALKA
jgi:zinc/manganese transport system substrate-binding protein